MKILGLIPARGGSKGVPRKNIKLLAGKPLIAYTIEQAQNAKSIDRLVLSTDDVEIAEVAKEYGVEVPFMRPDNLAQDSSGTLEVVRHAVRHFEERGEVYDAVCLLQASSPYRPTGVIDDAVREFLMQRPDSLVSVRRVPDEFNPHWVFNLDEKNRLRICTGEKKIIPRRQDLPSAYHRDGAIYITSMDTIKNGEDLLGDDILAFPVESPLLINIDTLADWDAADAFYRSQEKTS
ncbi:acylneuraminate cytidylyltransferase family protein [Akkermansiaceae bacterium]|nr:acylneuraminate cytidylyltransferase family protein [Akkermansiaceae bacterium]